MNEGSFSDALAGNYLAADTGSPGQARAVAQVVDIEDGIVHVRPLRGSVAGNSHLIEDHHLAS